jgi:hypothetical protein
MAIFKTSDDRVWPVEITVGTIKRVKTLLSIDLANPEDGEPPLIGRLSTDVLLLCDTLYAILKPQLDLAGVDDETFGGLLGGESLADGQAALFEALADFFQRLGRTEKAAMVRAQETATILATRAGATRIARRSWRGWTP